jgi:hypothetical protein
MYTDSDDNIVSGEIQVTDEVRSYILARKCDLRVCTSCGGPILLPTSIRPPKATDLQVSVDGYTIYISMYQARNLHSIHRGMIPRFYPYR